jgi:MFS transporter, OFA family, oxalate/formate antiporter
MNKRCFYALCGTLTLLVVGLVYSWSVIGKTIAASYPDWSQKTLSTTFTVTMAMFCVGGFLAGLLSKKISARIFIILAGVFYAVGFIVASMATTPIILYLGFGVLSGLGTGFAYNAVMGTISAWFPDKQGLISGILLMGFGFSSFIVGKLFAYLAPADGTDTWRMVFKSFGIIIFVLLFIFSFGVKKPGEKDAEELSKLAPKKEVNETSDNEFKTSEMLKKPVFWFYYIWAILLSAAGLALVSQASGIATEVVPDLNGGTVATIVGLISILNGLGRVIFGIIYDKFSFRVTMILDMAVFILAALILYIALNHGSMALLLIGFLMGGAAYGGVTPTNSAIINDFFGKKNFALNFSLINTNLMIASFSSIIAGNLYDSTKSYVSTIIMMVVLTVVGFLFSIMIRRPERSRG